MSRIRLNPAQRNFLQATLYHFEQSLRQSEDLIRRRSFDGILYATESHIPAHDEEQILAHIEKAIRHIRQLAADLGIKRQREKVPNQIIGLMSASWVNLAGVTRKRLQAYGESDPHTADEIEQAFSQLADLAKEIQNLVESADKKHDQAY